MGNVRLTMSFMRLQSKLMRMNIYIGSCATTFKLRFNDHMCSFRNNHYRSKTELATHIWSLKDKNINYSIHWRILARAASYKLGSNKCNLCIKEKLFILNANKDKIVNNIDLTIKCRHKFKFRLKNFKNPEN